MRPRPVPKRPPPPRAQRKLRRWPVSPPPVLAAPDAGRSPRKPRVLAWRRILASSATLDAHGVATVPPQRRSLRLLYATYLLSLRLSPSTPPVAPGSRRSRDAPLAPRRPPRALSDTLRATRQHTLRGSLAC